MAANASLAAASADRHAALDAGNRSSRNATLAGLIQIKRSPVDVHTHC
jgi:hypothetical protein